MRTTEELDNEIERLTGELEAAFCPTPSSRCSLMLLTPCRFVVYKYIPIAQTRYFILVPSMTVPVLSVNIGLPSQSQHLCVILLCLIPHCTLNDPQ